MLQRNTQVQHFSHFCGTVITAFWHFSPKNSLIQSLQLSFFSVDNLWLERSLFLTRTQPSPVSLDILLQGSTVLRVQTSSPWVWTSQGHFVTTVSLLAPADPKKRIALPPPADSGRLPWGFPKSSIFSQPENPHTPFCLTEQLLWPWSLNGGTGDTEMQNALWPSS